MRHTPTSPVELRSAKQLPGRFVRITKGKTLGLWHDNANRLNRAWRSQPDLMRERDEKFFGGAAVHNRWPTLAQFTCCAIVRGRRCNRIAIAETKHKHCLRHAGPTRAKLYRENCRKLFLSGRYPAHRWFKDEERRMRTRIRDRQRRRRGGWTLPGLTLRFVPVLEAKFRMDVALVLSGWPWDAVPDYHRDQLRWAWRKFVLDRQKPAAWDAKARAITLDLNSRGPIEGDLQHATGHEPHVLFVERRCTAFDWRSRTPPGEIERALAAPATAQGAIALRGRGVRPKGAVSDQGGGSTVRATARARAADETETDRLLQLHGRSLNKILAGINELAWPAILAAYDRYVANPTAAHHRAFMAACR